MCPPKRKACRIGSVVHDIYNSVTETSKKTAMATVHETENEPFSNPIAPANVSKNDSHQPTDHHPLTNDDFRKLLMTPRPSAAVAASIRSDKYPQSVRGSRKPLIKPETNENKNKKKKFFAAIKKQEEDVLAELAKKYRDRAKERRDGANPDYQSEDPLSAVHSYRAVAPDLKSTINAAERRKQMIEESKFLGGDMKHTHLVKGLDYALLQKVKAEIQDKEAEDDEEDAEEESEPMTAKETTEGEEEDPSAIKSVMANNIVNCLFKAKPQEKNDLFLPGRMAYIVDLEDEFSDDIPTTVIRSRADCPNWESITSMSTNDIVINKLTQILLYLRQGGGSKRKKKEKSLLVDEPKMKSEQKSTTKSADFEDSIYGDIGDYVAPVDRKERRTKDRRDDERKDKERHNREHNQHRQHSSYFEKSHRNEEENVNTSKSRTKDENEINKPLIPKANVFAGLHGEEQLHLRTKFSSKLDAPESYAECYPGAPENDDAILDSDDEVDYSKMDMGNKKGTIGRWDFDTAEEYGEYMSNKEAMPKAAFQYGVKMADGRKTRRIGKNKDEKAKLDRDLQKINAILSKRKAESAESNSTQFKTAQKSDSEYKRHKH
ncbi:IK cytokine down-regulator of HLA class II-like protein [Leptotrombidium deliense]|uniref:IK cytokine down-regulator of HLA class II-like protein n=1 Tax=Leptotrombidium deliense TaxID=299467 RepID=A0A443SJH1_9ACAR|nr:IK cytokine down-regulator of HLA class II-like protein [Leptotrombidium deliense]